MSQDCHMDVFNDLPTSLLLRMVAALLESVIHANDHRFPSGGPISLFHSRAVPSIKIETYMARIFKYTPFQNDVLLCMLVYFDRIARRMDGGPGAFTINSFNIHRLLITNIVVATKYASDTFYSNARYAKVGGLPLLELNKLELEFLKLCGFELYVRLEAIQEYGEQLVQHTLTHLPETLLPLMLLPPKPSHASRKRPLEDDSVVVQHAAADQQQPSCATFHHHFCALYPKQQPPHHTSTSSTKRHRSMTPSPKPTDTATTSSTRSISTA